MDALRVHWADPIFKGIGLPVVMSAKVVHVDGFGDMSGHAPTTFWGAPVALGSN